MTRVKGGTVSKNRRRKVLKEAKGYFGSKHRLYKTAQEQVFHSGNYAFRMTRLIDNMERQHLVVRIADKRDRRTNLIHLTKTGRELEGKARFIANKTLKEALQGLTLEELKVSQDVLRKVFTNIKD